SLDLGPTVGADICARELTGDCLTVDVWRINRGARMNARGGFDGGFGWHVPHVGGFREPQLGVQQLEPLGQVSVVSEVPVEQSGDPARPVLLLRLRWRSVEKGHSADLIAPGWRGVGNEARR